MTSPFLHKLWQAERKKESYETIPLRLMLTWEHIQLGRRGPMKMKQGGLLNWQSKKVSNSNPVSSHTICPSSHKSTWKYIQCSQCPVASASSIREAFSPPPPKKKQSFMKKDSKRGERVNRISWDFPWKGFGDPNPLTNWRNSFIMNSHCQPLRRVPVVLFLGAHGRNPPLCPPSKIDKTL